MKIFKLSVLVAVCGASLAGAALFWTSQNVQRTEVEMKQLQEEIAQERQSIRVLRAEWDYLNTPERLEEMATHYLHMEPQEVSAVVVDPAALPDPFVPVLPSRKPEFGVRAQSVSVAAPASIPAIEKPVTPERPLAEAPSPHRDDDFRALLDNIKKGGR